MEVENPFHPLGAHITGHEFHYSACMDPALPTLAPPTALKMLRGQGMIGKRDGLVSNNTFASYTHIHALGTPHWAPNFVRAALAWQQQKGQ